MLFIFPIIVDLLDVLCIQNGTPVWSFVEVATWSQIKICLNETKLPWLSAKNKFCFTLATKVAFAMLCMNLVWYWHMYACWILHFCDCRNLSQYHACVQTVAI